MLINTKDNDDMKEERRQSTIILFYTFGVINTKRREIKYKHQSHVDGYKKTTT